MDSTHHDRPLAAIGMRVGATFLLSAMFALAKLASDRGVNLLELLFFRQAIAVLPVLALVLSGPGIGSLRTQRPLKHMTRTAVGATGMALNFATVAMLPLAETQTLWFTTPLFATILSALVLRELVGVHRWSAVAIGFIGVLIVVQPQSGHIPLLGAMLGLGAAFVTAIVTILLRQMGRTEAPLTIVFWFATMSAIPLGCVLPWFWQAHDTLTWALIIAMGVTGGLGQIALTYSLRLAPVSVVAPVDYTSLIWSTAFGALLFGALPTPWTWIGAPVIIASGLYIVWREHRLRVPATPAIVE